MDINSNLSSKDVPDQLWYLLADNCRQIRQILRDVKVEVDTSQITRLGHTEMNMRGVSTEAPRSLNLTMTISQIMHCFP